jgi:D-lyxose ketol-isomerase
MKRSEINAIVQEAEQFLRAHHFHLPPFASWTPEQWAQRGEEIQEIYQRGLGWDVTDYGSGDFGRCGVLLFTLRNGSPAALASGRGKVYCEKILICKPQQRVVHHYHIAKTEDIINRSGGTLELILHLADPSGGFSEDPVTLRCDGVLRTVPAGGSVQLAPGESITLEPYVYHEFYAVEEAVLAGEVSTVNDDKNDNFFLDPVGRFPTIEEDAAPYRLLVTDYPAS